MQNLMNLADIDPEIERRHRRQNLLQSAVLIGGIGLVAAISAGLVWGLSGAVIVGMIIGAIAVLSPRFPAEAVMRLYQGRKVEAGRGSQLDAIVDALAARADLTPRPALYVIPSTTINAFAAGTRGAAAIGITEGLLRRLSLREIAAVLAHEIAHVRSNDLWIMGLADLLTRFTQVMSYVGLGLLVFNLLALLLGDPTVSWIAIVLLYLAPTISSLMQLGLSRAREYDADRYAVTLTGDPEGLASALRRLEQYTGRFWEDLTYPVPMRRTPQPSVLRTHPTTSDRVARLLELAGREQRPALVLAEGPLISLVGLGPNEMRPRYRWPGVWY